MPTSNTPNHDLNEQDKGDTDWHIPLNENFQILDGIVPIVDTDANKGNYDANTDQAFLAHDTGTLYRGDGSNWNRVDIPAATASASLGGSAPDATNYSTGDLVADSDNAGTVWFVYDDSASGGVSRVDPGSANNPIQETVDQSDFDELGSDPSSPSAGFRRLYAKSDGLYEVDSGGSVTGPLGSGGGGGGVDDGRVVASPGNVQSTIDNNASPSEGDVVVSLKSGTNYDPSSTWEVKDGIILDFNGAKVALTTDIDVIHIHPNGTVVNPYIDYTGVGTYTSNVFTVDSELYGRYDSGEDDGVAKVFGGKTVGTPGEGTVFYLHENVDTQFGDNNYNGRYLNHDIYECDKCVDIFSESNGYVNSHHFSGQWTGARLFYHLRGSGNINNLVHRNGLFQPKTVSDQAILQECGGQNIWHVAIWDKSAFDNTSATWELTGGAGVGNRVFDRWKWRDEDYLTDNSGGSGSGNHGYSMGRFLTISKDNGLRGYNTNGFEKRLVRLDTDGDVFFQSGDSSAQLVAKADGSVEVNPFAEQLTVKNGLELPSEDLTAKGDPGHPGTDGISVYYTHDGSGTPDAGLYRTDSGNSQYVKVEDNATTIAY